MTEAQLNTQSACHRLHHPPELRYVDLEDAPPNRTNSCRVALCFACHLGIFYLQLPSNQRHNQAFRHLSARVDKYTCIRVNDGLGSQQSQLIADFPRRFIPCARETTKLISPPSKGQAFRQPLWYGPNTIPRGLVKSSSAVEDNIIFLRGAQIVIFCFCRFPIGLRLPFELQISV